MLQAGKQKMDQMRQAETNRAEAAQAKNELEAYIISTQSALSGDEDVQAVTTSKQRDTFHADLTKVEEWLYDQGEHEQAPLFRQAPLASAALVLHTPCHWLGRRRTFICWQEEEQGVVSL